MIWLNVRVILPEVCVTLSGSSMASKYMLTVICAVCVDRVGSWALCPADWEAVKKISQMPPGRTDSFIVQQVQKAGPGTGTRSPNTLTDINTHEPVFTCELLFMKSLQRKETQ